MKAYLADSFSDEDGPMATEGKTVIIHASKAEVLAIARYMTEVAEHLEGANYCHMHLRDSMNGWSKSKHIDIEITVDERAV